jgi:putative ABC transport system permease protein
MIINNLRLTIRHLSRQKINTALHVTGLTLGMSVCLLIGLLLRYEWSFDRYHDKADRTYRIISTYSDANKTNYHFSTPLPLAEALRTGVSGLENVTLAHPFWTATLEVNSQKRFIEKNILAAEPEILDIFNVDVIAGNGYEALRKPYHALITETMAKKYFGKEDPLGKTFRFNNEFNITIGGVIRDQPSHTHLPFSMLVSFVAEKRFLGLDASNWGMMRGNSTFVVLPKLSDVENVEAQLTELANRHINSHPNLPKDIRGGFSLQALQNIHFEPVYGGGSAWVKSVDTTWLWFFAMIGVLVLGLACINFINLSTAQALTRAKEVGIRKSVGAGRHQLIAQFLMESCMLSLIAGILSIAIAQICLPAMNTLLEKGIVFDALKSPSLMAGLCATILLTGVLAGLYPAWLIARFNPTSSLKAGSATTQNIGSTALRKILVVVQFTISIALLIAVGLIAQQIGFLRGKGLGFNKDNIITVPVPDVSASHVFATALNEVPQVKDYSFSTGSPINGTHWGAMISLTDGDDPDRVLPTLILGDDRFCTVYGLKLIAGRFPIAADTTHVSSSLQKENQIMKVLVNEKLVKDLRFKSNEDAIGKHFWISMGGEDAEIIGVVTDFNNKSLHNPLNATIITQLPEVYEQAGIRIEASSDIPATIAAIEGAWKNTYPHEVFDYKFLDESIDNFYKDETRLYTLFKVFAVLAMCISCLGLWGLATLAAQHRTKEIGIRKVLGASVDNIILLLSKDFLAMVVIALMVAVPVVYYWMNNWLQNFAYQTEIGWEIFAIAGVASIGIALVTTSIQTLKAALANPVDSLRSE